MVCKLQIDTNFLENRKLRWDIVKNKPGPAQVGAISKAQK